MPGEALFAVTMSSVPSWVASATMTLNGCPAIGMCAARPKTAAEASGTTSSPAATTAAAKNLTSG